MMKVCLNKSEKETEYFPIGVRTRMKIVFCSPELKNIKILLKEVTSGKEMNKPMEIQHNQIIDVNEYSHLKIFFNPYRVDKSITLFFDDEIL